jgi:integrase/recombinase XerD
VQALSRDELLRLLAEAKKGRERDWLLMLVTYWHGLRASEAINLTVANFSGGFITIQRLKGSKRTTQPLMSHSNPLLDERVALPEFLGRQIEKDPGGRIFSISRVQYFRLIRLYGKRAGVPIHKLHPHVLKHSIAMDMIRDAGIENTRQYLGHKSGASTMEYLKASDEEASAAILRAEQGRVQNSDSGLDREDRLSVSESLRRALRIIEQNDQKGSRSRRKK